ncbi:MAG: hypothetical protein NTX63_01405 [Candidatus Peregrinibacteria bacterium]|nr:hypothetical protein [Candidatus Peregrinibacteria bacterium]
MIETYLNTIQKLSAKRGLTNVEKKRLEKDLQAVSERLQKKEYQKGGFSMNKFDVPDRTREFYVYLQFYCLIGKTWAAVLNELHIEKYKEIVDLCPGYTPKIELALFYLKYKGKLTILDKDRNAMNELEKFLALFEPQYTINKKTVDMFRSRAKKYKMVLANHIVDDLVIDYFSSKWSISSHDLYEKEGQFQALWQRVLEHEQDHYVEILPQIVRALEGYVETKGWICITHYKSYMEKLLDLENATRFTRKLLKGVIAELIKKGFKNHEEIPAKAFKKFRGHFGPRDCFVLQKLV